MKKLLPANHEMDLLSLQDQADRKLLPEKLTLIQIGELLYSEDADKHILYSNIVDACMHNRLAYEGDIDDWQVNVERWQENYYQKHYPNQPYQSLDYLIKADRDKESLDAFFKASEDNYYAVCNPSEILIHKEDLKAYFISINYWPVVNCKLAHWWGVMSNQPLTQQEINYQMQYVFKNGAPTISLRHFVDRLLTEYLSSDDALDATIKLIEDYGLEITDKVIEGNIVSSADLVAVLRLRKQEAEANFDNDCFDFWGALIKEGRYSIFRDELAKAYQRAGKTCFPWLDWDGALVEIANLNQKNVSGNRLVSESSQGESLDWYFEIGNSSNNIEPVRCWEKWLSRKSLSKKEVCCLILNCDPISYTDNCYRAFELVLNHLNDDYPNVDSKPLLAWLAWADENNYLGAAPHELIDWYSKNKTSSNITMETKPLAEELNSTINTEAPTNGTQDDTNLTKLEKQLQAISEVIEIKKFHLMQIPDGEKGTIEMICKADYPLLFNRDSSFNTAWKAGVGKKLFRMANHASYSKRGKS